MQKKKNDKEKLRDLNNVRVGDLMEDRGEALSFVRSAPACDTISSGEERI
jgi:hypothetical protein